jgi:hypothetical protein
MRTYVNNSSQPMDVISSNKLSKINKHLIIEYGLLFNVLHGNGGRNTRVVFVIQEFYVFVAKTVHVPNVRIQPDFGKGKWASLHLRLALLLVVLVDVHVAARKDKFAWPKPQDLGKHEGEQGIRGNIERESQKYIYAALVELAGEFPFCIHVPLGKAVAGGQGHLVKFAHVPGRKQVAAAHGVFLEGFDEFCDLIYLAAIGPFPMPPLHAIDGSEFAICFTPLVPNADLVVLQILYVTRSAQKPQKLMHDGFEVYELGRKQGKILAKIETKLCAKYTNSTNSGSVFSPFSSI